MFVFIKTEAKVTIAVRRVAKKQWKKRLQPRVGMRNVFIKSPFGSTNLRKRINLEDQSEVIPLFVH